MNSIIFVAPTLLITTGVFFSGSFFLDFPSSGEPEKNAFALEDRYPDFSEINLESGAFSNEDLKFGTPFEIQIAYFEHWAKTHEIFLEGTDKGRKYLSKAGFNPEKDRVELKQIPNILIAAQALYKIPEEVLEVMKGKTIYFSTEKGRSKAVFSAWGPNALNRGFIVEQNLREINVIHELGHIVDVHGIQGKFEDKNNIFPDAKSRRDKIFSVTIGYEPNSKWAPPGHITNYASESDLENFAEHFAYYVVRPDYFRDKIKQDPMLVDEYEFLRDYIFDGKEF